MQLKRGWVLNLLAAIAFITPFGVAALYVWSVIAQGVEPLFYILGALVAVNLALVVGIGLSRYIPACRLTVPSEPSKTSN